MKLFKIRLTNWRTVWSDNKPVNAFIVASLSEANALQQLETIELKESDYIIICLAEQCEITEEGLILEGFD